MFTSLVMPNNASSKYKAKTLLSIGLMFMLSACGSAKSDTAQNANTGANTSTAASKSTHTVTKSPIERGAKVFKRCQACHTLADGARHKIGPNLYAVFDNKAGSKEDYKYSNAMKTSEIIWTDETLRAYLRHPSKYMPGNKMSFIGLRKDEDLDAILAYLRAQTTPK